jgi:hypothetical protein
LKQSTAVPSAHAKILINQSHKQQRNNMGILDNLENAWDDEFQFESKPMEETDNMGRSTGAWTKGPAVYDSLAVKLFSETCCSDCSCKSE